MWRVSSPLRCVVRAAMLPPDHPKSSPRSIPSASSTLPVSHPARQYSSSLPSALTDTSSDGRPSSCAGQGTRAFPSRSSRISGNCARNAVRLAIGLRLLHDARECFEGHYGVAFGGSVAPAFHDGDSVLLPGILALPLRLVRKARQIDAADVFSFKHVIARVDVPCVFHACLSDAHGVDSLFA